MYTSHDLISVLTISLVDLGQIAVVLLQAKPDWFSGTFAKYRSAALLSAQSLERMSEMGTAQPAGTGSYW